MNWITLFRLGIFGISFVLSLIVLVLSSHMAYTAQTYRGIVYDFQGLAIASALLSMLTLGPFVLISILRNNAYFNMNIVEIPIIGLLWTLWFALSILSAEWASLWYPEGCPSRANAITKTFCLELLAIQGVAFIIWILFLKYIVAMVTLCVVGRFRGHSVWLVAVDIPAYLKSRSIGQPVLQDTKHQANTPVVAAANENQYQEPNVYSPNLELQQPQVSLQQTPLPMSVSYTRQYNTQPLQPLSFPQPQLHSPQSYSYPSPSSNPGVRSTSDSLQQESSRFQQPGIYAQHRDSHIHSPSLASSQLQPLSEQRLSQQYPPLPSPYEHEENVKQHQSWRSSSGSRVHRKLPQIPGPELQVVPQYTGGGDGRVVSSGNEKDAQRWSTWGNGSVSTGGLYSSSISPVVSTSQGSSDPRSDGATPQL